MQNADPHWRRELFGPDRAIPALIASQSGAQSPSVIVLHGLSASKESHRKELESLAMAGYYAIALDAPHHGERRSAWLQEMASAQGAQAHLLLLRMLPSLVNDTLTVVRQLQTTGHGPVGLVGISMGAFAALAASARDTTVATTVSILGSPDWSPRQGPVTPEMMGLMADAPIHRVDRFAPRALFLANAGLDVPVPPAASRRFADMLRPLYTDCPDRLAYHEYPLSEHHMRPSDWDDLWQRTLDFLGRHLVVNPTRG